MASSKEPLLKRCDLSQCEALCCFHGVYLNGDDIDQINEVLDKFPEQFEHLPDNWLMEGAFEGRAPGLKTATRPHTYKREIPSHFDATRCVFALEDGRCSLQVAAEKEGLHPWTYKPTACWLFPLHKQNRDDPVTAPVTANCDPYNRGLAFPGFASCLDCGRHCEDGTPWSALLKEELAYCQMKGLKVEMPP